MYTCITAQPVYISFYIADGCFAIILVYMTIKEHELVSDTITFFKRQRKT